MTLPTAYFNELYSAFEEAKHCKDGPEYLYNIAGSTIRLSFAGEALVSSICPALEHLKIEKASTQSLSVCLWDSASAGIKLPILPWQKDKMIAVEKDNKYQKDIDQFRIYFKDLHVQGVYQVGANTLSMLDSERNLAVYWVPNARQMHYYESGAPLRAINQWWAKSRGLQLVHAGAVGTSDGGVLLAGASGSGKSVTALSCIKSDLLYASDDYVLLSADPVPYLYSLYNSCKVKDSDIQRFPEFVPAIINEDNIKKEKTILFLHDYYPKKIVTGFKVRAILLPRVTGGKTKLNSVTASIALKAMAPSTIFQLPGAGQDDLKMMAKLVRQIPSYFLELGQDTDAIPDVILDLLADK